MNEFTPANKKIIRSIELQKEYKDEAVRKILADINRDAIKSAKTKKTYLVIFADK
jgi:hypothetical protein